MPGMASGDSTSRADLVALVEHRKAAWDAHDAEALSATHAPNGVVISPTGGVLEGRDEIARVYRLWFSAFPDIGWRIDDILVDGNRIVVVAQLSGTHAGDFFGVPASGRRVEAQVAELMVVEDGLIVEERRIYDFTGFLVQVGVLKAKPNA
jgi:steroid delta-isomerase-like uncharacterized protein